MGDHDAEHGQSQSSRSAERMIEERIDELRAIALGSFHMPVERAADDPIEDAARQVDPVEPDPASSPTASHAARMPGMTPGVARMQDSTPGQPRASRGPIVVPNLSPAMRDREDESLVQLVGTSVSRIEAAVHEDFARLEEMLRVWGAPSDKMLSGLQRMERSLRSDFTRVLETVHAMATSPTVIAAAIEASANQLEERNELRFNHLEGRMGSTSAELEQLTEAVREYGESVAKAAGSAGAIAGSNIAEKLGHQISEWAEGVAGHITDLHGVIEQLQHATSESSEAAQQSVQQVSEALADGMTTVADAVSSGLEAVGASMLELENRIVGDLVPLTSDDMTATMVEGAREAVSSTVVPVFSEAFASHEASTLEQFTELNSRLEALQEGIAAFTHDDVVSHIDAVRTEVLDAGIGLVVERMEDMRSDVLDRGVGEIVGRIEGMQSSVFENGFSEVLERIDSVRSSVIRDGFDALGKRLTTAQGEVVEKNFARMNRRFDVVHSTALKQGIQDLAQHVQSLQSATALELQESLATELGPIRSLLRRFVGSGADTGAVEELGSHLAEVLETLDAGLSRQITLLGSGISEQLGSVDTRLSERLQVLNIDGTLRHGVEEFARRVDETNAAGLEDLRTSMEPQLAELHTLVERVQQTAVEPAMVDELGERIASLIDVLEAGLGSQIWVLGSGLTEQLNRFEQLVARQYDSLEAASERGFSGIHGALDHIRQAAVEPGMLDALGSRIVARVDSLDAGLASLDAGLGSLGDRVEASGVSSVEELKASFVAELGSLRGLVQQLGEAGIEATMLDDLGTRVVSRIESLDADLSSRVLSRIESLDTRLGRHITSVNSGLTHQLDTLDARIAEQFNALEARTNRLLTSPSGIGGTGFESVQIGDMLRKAIAEQSRDVQGWIGKIEEAAQLVQRAAPDQLFARIEELEETLLVAQDEVPDELVERIETTVSPLLKHMAEFDARLARIGELEDRISQIANQQPRPEKEDAVTGRQITGMSEQIIEAVADSRVRQAEDIEIILDGMLAVWHQVAERMQSTDHRIDHLTSLVEQLAAQSSGQPVAELAAAKSVSTDDTPSSGKKTKSPIASTSRKSGKRPA
jgi:hypothetical protein